MRSARRRFIAATLATMAIGGALVTAIVGTALSAPGPAISQPSASTSKVSGPTASASTSVTASDQTGSSAADVTAATPETLGTTTPCDGADVAAPTDPRAHARRVAEELGVTVALAWLEPGDGVQSVGTADAAPAWSTIKVPLSVAVIQSGQGEQMSSKISSALRMSDNQAAADLWGSIGQDDAARAEAVTAVLRAAGDETTTVPSTRLYPPYSIFGQTAWTPANQVSFLLQLPCTAGAEQVLTDMASVTPSQAWGLGQVPGSVYKGGWGPDQPGGYTVRQFGWYENPAGARVPIAVSVSAASFEAGTNAADAVITAIR